ncbi:MAG: hypothetical protein OXC19_06255 [Bryobacterales bacterium]|nr:hypothetical protein [Bryobacterales bacterium]
METFASIVLGGSLAIGLVASLWYGVSSIAQDIQLQCVTSTPSDVNTDQVAREKFLNLLGAASQSMIVYDDGNNMPDSIYHNQHVIHAVREKLDENPQFRMRCLFNSKDPSPFREALSAYDGRVAIKTRNPLLPPMVTHFKIIDGGRKAYLSRHPFASPERRYKMVDCTKVPDKHSEYVQDVILGKHIKGFDAAFARAS